MALLFAEAGFAAETRGIAIGFPTAGLPGVDDLIPFGGKEGLVVGKLGVLACLAQQSQNGREGGDVRLTERLPIQVIGGAGHGLDRDPGGNCRFAANKAFEAQAQRPSQRLGKGGKQHPATGIGAREMDRPMKGDDGLAGAGRAGDSGGAGIAAGDDVPLGRVKEHRPAVPREVESAAEFVHIVQQAETALGVGMGEGVGGRRRGSDRGDGRFLAHRQAEELFLRLLRQVGEDVEQRHLGQGADVLDPFFRHAHGHQLRLAEGSKKLGAGRGGRPYRQLLHTLANLDKLHRPGGGMALDLPAFGPAIGGIVVVNISEQ